MADLNDLLVRIDATTEQLRREMKRADQAVNSTSRQIDTATKRIDKSFSALGRSAVRLGASLGVALSVRGIVRFGAAQLQAADSLLKTTQRIGGTTEALSELQHVANLSGVQFNTLTMGLQRMTRRVAEAANGTGEARAALKELNLDARELTQLPLDQQFEVIASRLALVSGESDRVRLAMKLFDSEGVALLQTMTRGAEGIREMREEARRLGLTLSQEAAEAAASANDEMMRMRSTVTALARDIATELAPAISTAAVFWRELLFGGEDSRMIELNQQVRDAQERVLSLSRELEEARQNTGMGVRGALGNYMVGTLEARLEEARAELEVLWAQFVEERDRLEASRETPTPTPQGSAIVPPSQALQPISFDPAGVAAARRRREEWAPFPTFDSGRVDEIIEMQREVGAIFDMTRTPLERYNAQVERLNALRDTHLNGKPLIDSDTYSRALEQAQEELKRLTDRQEETFNSFGQSLGWSIKSAFDDAILGIETSFGDMLKRLAVQAATSQIFAALGALGGPVGNVMSFLGFGGTRATGGPTTAGKAYLVGERGPELHVPTSSGFVVPNHKLGGVTVHIGHITSDNPEAVRLAATEAVTTAVAIAGQQTDAKLRAMQRPSMV